MPPEFSVILPTRGASPHLAAALASALEARADLEICLVHDRRPGQPALGAELAGDARVRLFESTGPGPGRARNVGLGAARGRFVAFLDDDDLWLADHLQRAREQLDRDDGALLASCDAYLFEDGTPDGSLPAPRDPSVLPRFRPERPAGALALRDLLLENPILTPSVVLVRERLTAASRFREELPVMEDYELWLRLAREGRLHYDARPSVVVRRRPGSASRDRRAMAEQALAILAEPWATGLASGLLTTAEVRRRSGQLWHDLAYARLVDGDARGARAAARRSARHLPLLAKNYIYLLASYLPRAARRSLFAAADRARRGGRARGTP